MSDCTSNAVFCMVMHRKKRISFNESKDDGVSQEPVYDSNSKASKIVNFGID